MKDLKIYIIVATTLFTLYIIANLNRPKPVDWAETFVNKEKAPFGTYVIYYQIHDLFPTSKISAYRQPVYNVLTNDSVKQASYIIICNGINLSKVDYEQLVKHIKSGNDVFIAATSFGSLFSKNLKLEANTNYNIQQQTTPLSFTNPTLDTNKTYLVDKGAGDYYFNKIDTTKALVLGQNNNHKATFVKYSFGKGNLFLMANPKMLSNYSMLKPAGAQYAATALSYLKNTQQILWDEYYTQGSNENESPMRVFLGNPALSMAYYIALWGLFIFVLYEIKRRQRIIPVIEPLANSTLDFVNVVGQVYYEKRDNANIARKKGIYLLSYLRDKYHLKTSLPDSEFIEKLSQKTGVEALLAKNLINAINFVNTHERITDDELMKLNYLIEQFYIQSR